MAEEELKLVDKRAALEELGLDVEDYQELLGDLKDFVDTAIPRLQKAVRERNRQEIKEIAHSLKGALKNLRFQRAGGIAQGIERDHHESSFESLAFQTAQLDQIVEESFSYLAQEG